MKKLLLLTGLVFSSSVSFGQSHESITENRSRNSSSLFYNQSIVVYDGSITRSGDESIFGERNQDVSGFGLRSAFGIETFDFVQLSLAHTLIDQQAKSTSLDHFSGSEVTGDVSLKFNSPIGNLGFGLALYATQVSLQNTEKTSRFIGDGRVRHVHWNYFLSKLFSLNLRYETSEGVYRSQGGDTGIDKFEMDRSGFGAGFSFWF